MQKGTTSKGMEANKNFAKWLSCGIQISGTFGLHHVLLRCPETKQWENGIFKYKIVEYEGGCSL
jgi:hypothetical protein